jgi:hypothetical protein
MKRQRGRNRKPGGGGGGGGGHNPNRAFESNGPDGVKIRGAAQHVYERYHQLARDAFASGDRVLAENYLQHAEHYFRVLRTLQPQRPVAEIAARDAFASGFDIDFEDEGGGEQEMEGQPEAVGEEGGEQPQPYVREGREGGEFRRDRDRQGGERQGGERQGGERQGGERQGGERQGGERQGGEHRAEGEGGFREGGRRESRRERFERRREERRMRGPQEGHPGGEGSNADPLAVVEPRAAELAPRMEDEGSPVLRAEDGAESQMPAFLRQAVPAAAPASPEGEPEAEAAERPRRTRRRRPETFEAADADAPAEEQA